MAQESINSIFGAALQQLGIQIVTQMRSELDKKGINASGNLSRSITSEVKGDNDGVYLEISMDDYGEAIDQGRSPSRKGGPKQNWRVKIDQWLSAKGIQPRQSGMSKQTLAFLITRKINRRGYTAKPFVNSSITTVLSKDQSGLFANGLEKSINNIFRKK